MERTESSFTQTCAACGASRVVQNQSVVVRGREGHICLELPACVCGAVEVLLPSGIEVEHPRPGSEGHRHQLVVDELAARVSERGLTQSQLDAIARWLPVDAKLTLLFPKRP